MIDEELLIAIYISDYVNLFRGSLKFFQDIQFRFAQGSFW